MSQVSYEMALQEVSEILSFEDARRILADTFLLSAGQPAVQVYLYEYVHARNPGLHLPADWEKTYLPRITARVGNLAQGMVAAKKHPSHDRFGQEITDFPGTAGSEFKQFAAALHIPSQPRSLQEIIGDLVEEIIIDDYQRLELAARRGRDNFRSRLDHLKSDKVQPRSDIFLRDLLPAIKVYCEAIPPERLSRQPARLNDIPVSQALLVIQGACQPIQGRMRG